MANVDNGKKSMLKDAGILFAITLIAGVILGFVYELTKEPIRLQEEKAVREACQTVFATADAFEVLEYAVPEELERELSGNGIKPGTLYEALGNGGNHLGYVLEITSTEGYGGSITLYVGVTQDGVLNGVSILSISETPGLGMRAEEVLIPQFEGKEAGEFTYTKTGSTLDSEIDAISGATITTKAFVNAVNGALSVTEQLGQSE